MYGHVFLQPHISQKILEFPDRIEDKKKLQQFLGLINYARPYLKDIGKTCKYLYAKTGAAGQIYFNLEDEKVVRKIEEMVKTLPKLSLPIDTDYLIVQTDGCENGWGAVPFRKTK